MKCICCSKNYILVRGYKDIYKCSSCDHLFRDYKEDATSFHRDEYRKVEIKERGEISSDGTVNDKFHKIREKMTSNRIKMLSGFIEQDQKCYDVGAGAGTFARKLRPLVKSIRCSELDPALIAECKRNGLEVDSIGLLEMNTQEKYDFVFMWHVLEHIPDALAARDKLWDLTNKLVCVEVPTLVPLDGQGRHRRVKPVNYKNSFDGHFHYYTEKSFRRLYEERFKILRITVGAQNPAMMAIIEKRQ